MHENMNILLHECMDIHSVYAVLCVGSYAWSSFVCMCCLCMYISSNVIFHASDSYIEDGGWAGRSSFPHIIVSYNMQGKLRQWSEGNLAWMGVVVRGCKKSQRSLLMYFIFVAILPWRGALCCPIKLKHSLPPNFPLPPGPFGNKSIGFGWGLVSFRA